MLPKLMQYNADNLEKAVLPGVAHRISKQERETVNLSKETLRGREINQHVLG